MLARWTVVTIPLHRRVPPEPIRSFRGGRQAFAIRCVGAKVVSIYNGDVAF